MSIMLAHRRLPRASLHQHASSCRCRVESVSLGSPLPRSDTRERQITGVASCSLEISCTVVVALGLAVGTNQFLLQDLKVCDAELRQFHV